MVCKLRQGGSAPCCCRAAPGQPSSERGGAAGLVLTAPGLSALRTWSEAWARCPVRGRFLPTEAAAARLRSVCTSSPRGPHTSCCVAWPCTALLQVVRPHCSACPQWPAAGHQDDCSGIRTYTCPRRPLGPCVPSPVPSRGPGGGTAMPPRWGLPRVLEAAFP